MGRSDTSPDTPSAVEFLKVVGRRSGLFLPRDEGRYAFVHLSFQEYFAAVALKREVTRLRWAKGNASRLGFDRDTLAGWAGLSVWRETFSFLFELLASEEEDDWHADLLDCVFGENFSRLDGSESDEVSVALGHLLARLVANSRSGLSSEKRDSALEYCVRTQFRIPFHVLFTNIFGTLLSDDVDMNATVFKKIKAQMKQTGSWELDLRGTSISDLSPIVNLTMLESLDLMGTSVSDISPIANLTALQSLKLEDAQVSDIDLVVRLPRLRSLTLAGSSVSDLSPLSKCLALQEIDLIATKISDLSPLAYLPTLRTLLCLVAPVSDLSPLAQLPAFESLALMDTLVSDLAPLSDFAALQFLYLGNPISDLSPLAGLAELRSLRLSVGPDLDIAPLASLPKLQDLHLFGNPISNLTPLVHLGSLEKLDFRGMEISDDVVEELRKCRPDIEILRRTESGEERR